MSKTEYEERYNQYLIEYQAQMANFEQNFPDHCKQCGGWGGSYISYDPSPSGVSLGSGTMLDWEPCEACLMKGICPICGHRHNNPEWMNHEGDKCQNCGWQIEAEFGVPQPPEYDPPIEFPNDNWMFGDEYSGDWVNDR